jgi:hypothetical protein
LDQHADSTDTDIEPMQVDSTNHRGLS